MISSKKPQAISRSEYIKRLLPIFHKKFILLLIYLKKNFPFYMDAIASLQELSLVAEILLSTVTGRVQNAMYSTNMEPIF